MEFSFSVEELQSIVQPSRLAGALAGRLTGIAALKTAQPGDLSFLGSKKYKDAVASTRASLILVPEDFVGTPAPGQAYFFVPNPSLALARICARIEQSLWPRPAPGVHPSAVIDPASHVHQSASVGPLCIVEAGAVVGPGTQLHGSVFVGRNAKIGADCWLMPRAVVGTECLLGDRVRLQPGVVIGSDGFGYELTAGRHEKVPQIGNVVIENDVEIGANATVDRARFSSTIVGEGTKIDNLVQIGHNVQIGKHCVLCALVGISGSTTLGDYVVMGGMAGAAGHLTIGSGAMIAGQTAVVNSVEPKAFVKGPSCLPYTLEQRIQVLRKRLPELFKRVDHLESQMADSGATD